MCLRSGWLHLPVTRLIHRRESARLAMRAQLCCSSMLSLCLFWLPPAIHHRCCSFFALVVNGIPSFFAPGQQVVRAGCALADAVLAHVDPHLHRHFLRHYGPAATHAELLFFARVASMYASRPPLRRVVRLWDGILAFGVHLLPVLCAAEAVARRSELLAAERDAITRFQGESSVVGTEAATGLCA